MNSSKPFLRSSMNSSSNRPARGRVHMVMGHKALRTTTGTYHHPLWKEAVVLEPFPAMEELQSARMHFHSASSKTNVSKSQLKWWAFQTSNKLNVQVLCLPYCLSLAPSWATQSLGSAAALRTPWVWRWECLSAGNSKTSVKSQWNDEPLLRMEDIRATCNHNLEAVFSKATRERETLITMHHAY